MWLFLVLFSSAYLGCIKQGSTGDLTIHRSQSDEVLLEISLQAQETFPVFIEKVQNPRPEERDFLVKYPFEAEPGSGFSHEQIWLGDITAKDGLYYGSIANMPYYVTHLKPGDRVLFDMSAITDWMYIRDDKIIGGLSIKYFIEQIPKPNWGPNLSKYYEMFE
jgi:uncharacterized protein YegJ (DUF2314 family)